MVLSSISLRVVGIALLFCGTTQGSAWGNIADEVGVEWAFDVTGDSADGGLELGFMMSDDIPFAERGPGTDCTTISPEDILEFLMLYQVPTILSFNTYLRTNPPVIRPLLDLPTLQPNYDACDCLTFYGTVFYSQMRDMYLTACGPCLRDYLAVLSDGDLINALDEFFNQIAPNANIPNVIPLFNNIRLDMRRIGVMLGLSACPGNWRVSVQCPLYYLENNFFLARPDRDRLSTQRYFSDVSIGTMPGNPDLFVRDHLINDKVGFGDMRWMADYRLGSARNFARLGAQLTLPLNVILAQGIYGNCFNKNAVQPFINAQYIAYLACLAVPPSSPPPTPEQLAVANQAKVLLANLAMSYGVTYLDWLTTTVATNPIGQDTISVGVYIQPEWYIGNHVRMGIFAEYDYWAPQYQPRTLNTLFDGAAIRTTDYTENPDDASINLLFLETQAANILYPPIHVVRVKQGDVVKARGWLTYARSNFEVTGGFDLWFQDRERLCVCGPELVGRVNTATATRPAALQCKLYGLFDTIFNDPTVSWIGWKVGLRCDATVYHTGIGGDWLVGITAVADF